jgi:hypothetical protein
MFGITVVFATTAVAVTTQHSNPLAIAQSSNSPSKQTSNSGTGLGNLKQLGKVIGNGSKIIANNTNIGNPHAFQSFTKEHKVKSSTPQSIKALPSNPQLLKSKNSTGSSSKTGGK